MFFFDRGGRVQAPSRPQDAEDVLRYGAGGGKRGSERRPHRYQQLPLHARHLPE